MPSGSGWLARLGQRDAGPYASRDVALQVVMAEARELRRKDQTVRVAVEDRSGSTKCEVCLCSRFLDHITFGLRCKQQDQQPRNDRFEIRHLRMGIQQKKRQS